MTNTAPKTITIPLTDYQSLTQQIEDLEDVLAVQQSVHEQSFPSELVDRILDGENPVKEFRKFRGIKQNVLAETCGISNAFLSQIEAGTRTASIAVYRKLADALNLDIDDLV